MRRWVWTLLCVVGGIAAVTPWAGAEQSSHERRCGPWETRIYAPSDGQALREIYDLIQFRYRTMEDVEFSQLGKRRLLVHACATTHDELAKMFAQIDPPTSQHTLRAVLVEARAEDGPIDASLLDSEREALADVADILRFGTIRRLDGVLVHVESGSYHRIARTFGLDINDLRDSGERLEMGVAFHRFLEGGQQRLFATEVGFEVGETVVVGNTRLDDEVTVVLLLTGLR